MKPEKQKKTRDCFITTFLLNWGNQYLFYKDERYRLPPFLLTHTHTDSHTRKLFLAYFIYHNKRIAKRKYFALAYTEMGRIRVNWNPQVNPGTLTNSHNVAIDPSTQSKQCLIGIHGRPGTHFRQSTKCRAELAWLQNTFARWLMEEIESMDQLLKAVGLNSWSS